jgi:SAM-dependent methyltransferase
LGPFIEIGGDIGSKSMLLENELGVTGAAVDLSVDSLGAAPEVARRLNYSRIPLRICCDAADLPFLDQTFQFAYCFQTLHHFANPKPVIDEVHRVLGNGGHFYFDEEPIRRWLCLNLYRCGRPEDLKGFNKWLLNTGLIRYVAEAHIGSGPETEWGICENQRLSLRRWKKLLAAFEIIELQHPSFATRDAYLVGKVLRYAGIPTHWIERTTASLFGGTMQALCRVGKGLPARANHDDLLKLMQCPECHAPISYRTRESRFCCDACGPFEACDNVHLLLRREQAKQLYPLLLKREKADRRDGC